VYESDGETVIGEFPLSTDGVTQQDIDDWIKPEFCD
jgi:hypothetical protein